MDAQDHANTLRELADEVVQCRLRESHSLRRRLSGARPSVRITGLKKVPRVPGHRNESAELYCVACLRDVGRHHSCGGDVIVIRATRGASSVKTDPELWLLSFDVLMGRLERRGPFFVHRYAARVLTDARIGGDTYREIGRRYGIAQYDVPDIVDRAIAHLFAALTVANLPPTWRGFEVEAEY